MNDSTSYWDRYAWLYDLEINLTSRAAYAAMYSLMAQSLRSDMDILEVATGTGMFALNIAPYVRSVAATDFSRKMIERANSKRRPDNVSFGIEDAAALSFADHTFDGAIVANALHIMPNPAKALSEIARVLKPGGLLIAPNFMQGHLRNGGFNLSYALLKMMKFKAAFMWNPDEYISFINHNGYKVARTHMLKAAFPLVYLEAVKK